MFKTSMQQIRDNVVRMIETIKPMFLPAMEITVVIRHPAPHMEGCYLIITSDDQAAVAECLKKDDDKRKADQLLLREPKKR